MKIEEIIIKDGLEGKVSKEDVKKVFKDVSSKSGRMKGLYDLGFYVGSIRDILKVEGIEVSYNFVYNVISSEVDNVRKKGNNGGESKSKRIEELLKEGKDVRGVIEEFIKEGVYVNMNMVYSIRKKLVKKGELVK